jgi:hypothetical protein
LDRPIDIRRAAAGRPWIASGKLYWVPSKTPKTFETVVVPLSPDDSTVNMLFSLLVVL